MRLLVTDVIKAAIYSGKRSRKVVEIAEREMPVPKEDEVLVRVRAASINPLDWRMKSRRPGVDLAGEVESVGKNVVAFKAGDRVFGTGKGSFGEYACARAKHLAVLPQGVSFEQGAAVPIAGLTALQGLHDVAHLQAGETVLINGAAGGVGTFAVQIAKALGAHVTGVCSSRNVEQSLSLGAERVVDYTRADFAEEEARYDLLLDDVGNRELSAFRRVLKRRGRCVMVGAPKRLSAVLLRLIRARISSWFHAQKLTFFIAKVKREDLKLLGEWMQAGRIAPVVERVFPLAQASEAIAYVEEGHARGKVILCMGQHC